MERKMYRKIILMLILLSKLTSCSAMSVETEYLYKMIKWHGQRYEKKDVMFLTGTGGSVPDKKINYFSLHYECDKKLKIDEVRVLFVNAVEDFIAKVNSMPESQNYTSESPITFESVDLMIGFTDGPNFDVEPPYISLVYIAKKQIHYKQRDLVNNCFIGNPYKESYEEALRIVKESGQLHQQMKLLK